MGQDPAAVARPPEHPPVRRREARDRGSRLTGAIDTPGFGYSEAPEGILDEAETSAFVEAFVDTFYLDRVDVVGHSLGGAIATVFALHQPERVGKLTLVVPAGTCTEAGVEAAAPFDEDRNTVAFESAGPLRTIVPCTVRRPNWRAGVTVSALSE